jgi:hypothetical protein
MTTHTSNLARLLAIVFLAGLLLASFACAPTRTRPDGLYPKTGVRLRPGMRVVPMNQLRCLGGGIGGCSLGGRPE